MLSSGGPGGPAVYGGLMLAAGLACGGVFAAAARPDGAAQGALVRPLYAADLIGGAAGSVAASFVLLPIVGLPGTALLVAGLAALLLLAL